MPVGIARSGGAADRSAGMAGGAAQGVAPLAGARAASGALAAPFERRRVRVPAAHLGRQPAHQLLGRLRMLAGERAADEDALDGLNEPTLLHLL